MHNLGEETEQIEFKKSTGELKEGVISIASILNKHGSGELYFGVKNNGDVIYVRFKGSRRPYIAYGIPRIRVADEDTQMDQELYREMLNARENRTDSWETKLSKYHIADIDREAFEGYLRKAKQVGRIALDSDDVEYIMTKLELCEGDTLLNAGAALFVNCGINELQMARFASDERLTFNDIKRYTGSIIELADRAILYVADAMDWRVEFDGSLERKEYPEIPTDAVREAVINAFGHRIIESGQSVEVAIYKSFIEIYSPGKFPEGVTPQQFITEIRKPIRRNPRITRTLYYSKDMEIFATGLKRISDACSKAGVKVEFYGDEYGFTVRFYRHCGEGWSENHTSNILKNDIGDLREGDNKKNDFAQNERSLSEVLGEVLKKTDYEKVLPIITVLEGAGEITPREAEEICKKSPATVRRYLGLLVNSGYVISEGNTNSIVYKVIENI